MKPEKLFRLLSLGFLTIGFMAAVAGANRENDSTIEAVDDLIYDLRAIEEAESINQGQFQPTEANTLWITDKQKEEEKNLASSSQSLSESAN